MYIAYSKSSIRNKFDHSHRFYIFLYPVYCFLVLLAVAILLCVLLDLFCWPPAPMLNMLPPAGAGAAAPNPGELAPKLAGAAPKLVFGAPNAGPGFAAVPNGFA